MVLTEPHTSASQISRARGCMRRWAWERVAPLPPGPEQVTRLTLGKDVHAVAEAYHRDGTRPDRDTPAGRLFMPALPYLPSPGTGQTELEIRLDEPHVLGYVDLFAPAWDPVHAPAEHVILDYKTKNTLQASRLFSGPGDLLTDPQSLVYATWYFRAHAQDRVGMRWLYLRVLGRPAARVCDAVLSREQVQEAWTRLIEPVARTLITLRKSSLDPLTLPPSPSECMRYGARYACPYITRCGLTVRDRVQGAMDMGLLEDLKAQEQSAKTSVLVKTEPTPEPAKRPAAKAKGVNPPEAQTPAQPEPVVPVVSDADLAAAVRLIARVLRGA